MSHIKPIIYTGNTFVNKEPSSDASTIKDLSGANFFVISEAEYVIASSLGGSNEGVALDEEMLREVEKRNYEAVLSPVPPKVLQL